MLFQNHSQGPVLEGPSAELSLNKLFFGTLYDSRDIRKCTFWTPFSATTVPKEDEAELLGVTFSRIPFHETIVISVPLGHREYICSMEIGSSSVFVAFCCAMFYKTFVSLVFITHR